jgi:hypothetical protein
MHEYHQVGNKWRLLRRLFIPLLLCFRKVQWLVLILCINAPMGCKPFMKKDSDMQ